MLRLFQLALGLVLVMLSDIGDSDAKRIQTRHLIPRNFISVRRNLYQEKELRIAYRRILVLETSASLSQDFDMVIRQVTDGKRFVQGVYQGGVLKDCDYNQDKDKILEFVDDFIAAALVPRQKQFGDVFAAYDKSDNTANTTVAFQYYHNLKFLKEFQELVAVRPLAKACHHFLRNLKHVAREMARHGNDTGDIVLEDGDIRPGLVAANDSGHRIGKRSTAPVKQTRSTRSTFDFNSVLIFPGTKWCGKGDLATCYEDLGPDGTDVCCRDHDCCPYIIPPFTSRFNTFNYRFYSVVHCDCDNRFRGCLRNTVSTTANMIGKIYFNILGSKCFTFQEREVCEERAWWGGCKKTQTQTKALIQSQSSFDHEKELERQKIEADKLGNVLDNTLNDETQVT